MSFTNDPVPLTYIGDYSALEVMELGRTVTRGEEFDAPAEYAARQLGLRPTQWDCDDPDVLDAAAVIQAAEAAALATYLQQFETDQEKEARRIASIKTTLQIPQDP